MLWGGHRAKINRKGGLEEAEIRLARVMAAAAKSESISSFKLGLVGDKADKRSWGSRGFDLVGFPSELGA